MDFFREALQNKDVFTTLWTTGVFMLFLAILNKISKDLKQTMENGFNRIALSVWKKVVEDPYTLLAIAEKAIYSTTTQKLNFLRRRLIQNDIKNNREIIEKHIRTTFMSISETYINFLNDFNTPVGLLWKWVAWNFKMDKFLATIYKVFFDETLTIDRKIELFESIIQDFQNDLWDDFKLQLNL
jgi:hypothetical protein